MLQYSFIIPVYNRPNEIKELLESMVRLKYTKSFEVVIIEDGSTDTSEKIVKKFNTKLDISYYSKPNSGPGDSRNFGMRKAKGNYFLILDSDVILPPDYLQEVNIGLKARYTDCFGGPDDADKSFSNLQKGINYAMTSILTTGGIRGKANTKSSFEPRSFNMGLSKKAFQASGGFGKIHPGEDPDLSIRLNQQGFETQLLAHAKVFHKRRINWESFFKQVNKFGLVRPIITQWHPKTAKLTYWFPTVFIAGILVSLIFIGLGCYLPLLCYVLYFILVFSGAAIKNRSINVAIYAIVATAIQFFGYGVGFAKSTLYIRVLGKEPHDAFPKLFFR